MQIIPLTSDYDQSLIVQLGDFKYELAVAWIERNKIWAFDMTLDPDQELLVAGVPMLIGQDMLAPYALGRGGLVMTDLSAKNTDAGPEDLGTRVVMTWLSIEELAILADAQRGAGVPQTIVVPGVPGGGAAPAPGGGGSGGGGGTIVNQVINQTVNNFNLSGAGSFGQISEMSDESGDETLIFRDIGLPSVAATMALVARILAGGSGTLRIYTGGTFAEAIGSTGTPSGTLRDSVAVAGDDTYDLDASFANPGGMIPIKITMQSSAPATEINVSIIKGSLG